MAPNNNNSKHNSHFQLEDLTIHGEEERTFKNNSHITSKQGRALLWHEILENKNETAYLIDNADNELLQALSKVRILNDASTNDSWLERFGASLFDIPLDLVKDLERCAPENFSARVADFNDNLFYKMQDEFGMEHLGLNSEDMQNIINSDQFLISFLSTETTTPQPAHVDFPWEFLDEQGDSLEIGVFPLTTEGMFLQVWARNDDPSSVSIEGEIIYIPYGKLLTLPASTIHGGGFRSTHDCLNHGNLRCHLYIARNGGRLSRFQTNKYTEPGNKRKELAERYIDASAMDTLMHSFFVQTK